jgi:hypothetical protein
MVDEPEPLDWLRLAILAVVSHASRPLTPEEIMDEIGRLALEAHVRPPSHRRR